LRHWATSQKVAGLFADMFTRLAYSIQPQYCPVFDSDSNRIEYQEYHLGLSGSRCVGLTTLPPSCADCLVILGAPDSCNPRSLSRSVQGLLCLFVRIDDVMDFYTWGRK
jgi:hypothetical protein